MSLSMTRKRRNNAGSKMASLLDNEERVDHFYVNTYGGFQEEENDMDYVTDDTDSEDTDFSSTDENEDNMTDDQKEEDLKIKPKTKTKLSYSRKGKQNKSRKQKTNVEGVPLEVNLSSMGHMFSKSISFGNKRLLAETIIEKRLKFEEEDTLLDVINNNNSKVKTKSKQLSQKELLEEAVITEKMNLKSLKEWQKLELERNQKNKINKHSIKGPFIRYNSVSMPLIKELENEKSVETNISETHNSGAKSYSRNFITFSDDEAYDSLLKSSSRGRQKPSKRVQSLCTVTQKPARYFDPISEMSFANSQAFKAIRNQYYNALEIYENMNDKEVKQWIDWKNNFSQKWVEWHQKHLPYLSDKTDVSEVKEEFQVIEEKVPKSRNRSKRKKKEIVNSCHN